MLVEVLNKNFRCQRSYEACFPVSVLLESLCSSWAVRINLPRADPFIPQITISEWLHIR